MEKEMKKGVKNIRQTERTVFNDEEIRRYVYTRMIYSTIMKLTPSPISLFSARCFLFSCIR